VRASARVEILTIGNEILTGEILDTNTNWLCDLVHHRGGTVVRVTVLPDELGIIEEAVRAALHRKVDILFATGGLGPTADDLTLQAIAAGTDREIELNPKALEMVRTQYEYFSTRGKPLTGGMTRARQKMAHLPQGAEPLLNSAGIAPGVFLHVNQTTIIALPGVPSEQRAIVNQSLAQFLNQSFRDGSSLSRRLAVNCGGESVIEPVLTLIASKYPDIYTKSLAHAIGKYADLDVVMTITGLGEKESLLNRAFEELCFEIKSLGFSVTVHDAD
jgi:molybdenum cofactor synthesis domain-containing protein